MCIYVCIKGVQVRVCIYGSLSESGVSMYVFVCDVCAYESVCLCMCVLKYAWLCLQEYVCIKVCVH